MSIAIAAAIVFVFLILILFIPIGIGMKYEKNALILVRIAFLSFSVPIKKKIKKKSPPKKNKEPKKKEDMKGAEELERSALGLDFILDLLGDFRRFARKGLKLEKFELKIEIGVQDAAVTAIATGALWGAAYSLVALLERLFIIKKPVVNVNPRYNEEVFALTARGIIVTSIAHIIAVGLILWIKYLKYKNSKGRTNK